jgi:hypothetical protein
VPKNSEDGYLKQLAFTKLDPTDFIFGFFEISGNPTKALRKRSDPSEPPKVDDLTI